MVKYVNANYDIIKQKVPVLNLNSVVHSPEESSKEDCESGVVKNQSDFTEEIKMYRSVTYKPGGAPHSQLGYDVYRSDYTLDATVAEGFVHTIKLNNFSGLVQRLG